MQEMMHASRFLLPSAPSDDGPTPTYALIVLNQPLPRITPILWNHAKFRVFADGGANRVYDELPRLLPHQDSLSVRKWYKPDIIKGDMDSIRPDVKDYYENEGTEIVYDSDQDTTDLHKCISYISDIPTLDKSCLYIVVAGALGGRFDHEAGNVNVLCIFSSMRIILLSDDCLVQLLPGNHHHKIQIQSSIEGPHCGLIPIGMPCRNTTTTGLKWNLANSEMRFGGLISTSNLVEEETVTVQSDCDLLWTISIKNTSRNSLLDASQVANALDQVH